MKSHTNEMWRESILPERKGHVEKFPEKMQE